ncbi:MAG: hypothetical protein COT33_00125 [Candidatus Nealsonbacteria bacterium CG08_land_8_20_14_0_20_38_20]|uniref:Uncharacterized protein n=1 Tax=Candidatus Nealsonbacteria bacterium CG08_land_8_20_14_0_20_38_20 TaxID=1974705 RepID=A0A2H0YMQ6_9BACT|nr:MAG: hypothetical protein COT33_00125 [Candidatus Nealsonbacteria bacterium CG08_land_8_20_14_0_20_38_20]
MGNPERPKTLIRKEKGKIERPELDENWEKIAKDAGLTGEEAGVAVKFLDEIKKRFRPEAKGEKPGDYIESFRKILRDYNITLTLGDMNSLAHFPIKNKINAKELKENMEKLVERGVTSTDGLFEKLSEIYKEDKDKNWIKYLVQKNIKKEEILDKFLKSYVKEPAMYFLKYHTIGQIEKHALCRELAASGLIKKIEAIKAKERRKESPTEASTTDRFFYKNIKGLNLKKKDLGE